MALEASYYNRKNSILYWQSYLKLSGFLSRNGLEIETIINEIESIRKIIRNVIRKYVDPNQCKTKLCTAFEKVILSINIALEEFCIIYQLDNNQKQQLLDILPNMLTIINNSDNWITSLRSFDNEIGVLINLIGLEEEKSMCDNNRDACHKYRDKYYTEEYFCSFLDNLSIDTELHSNYPKNSKFTIWEISSNLVPMKKNTIMMMMMMMTDRPYYKQNFFDFSRIILPKKVLSVKAHLANKVVGKVVVTKSSLMAKEIVKNQLQKSSIHNIN